MAGVSKHNIVKTNQTTLKKEKKKEKEEGRNNSNYIHKTLCRKERINIIFRRCPRFFLLIS